MSIFRPTAHPTADRASFRSALAVIAIAGLAAIGVTAFAAPASADDSARAEESAAVAVEAEPAAEPEPETTGSGDADAADAAAQPPAADPAPPAPADDAAEAPPADTAAPPAQEAAPPEDATQAPAEVPAAAALAAPLLVPPGDEVVDKVEICHGTAAHNNPYIVNEPAADGDVSGHADHVGPIWFPGIEEVWGDIIPPFFYDDGGEEPAFFPGLNWDAEGQAIYENDCEIPTPTPEVTISGGICIMFSVTQVTVALDGLVDNVDYLIEVWQGDVLVDSASISDESGSAERQFTLDPGDYQVVVSQSIIEDVWDVIFTGDITVEACPELDIAVTPGDCSIGSNGTATIELTGLIEGEEYGWEVFGDDYSLIDSFVAGDDIASFTLFTLPPGSFVAVVWWTGGEGVEASTTFDVEPCQPEITVEVTECPAAGGTGSALLKLSSLVAGVEYDVKVTDRGAADGTPYGGVHSVMGDADGNAQLVVSNLPGGKDFTAWVDGVWSPPMVDDIAVAAAVAEGDVLLHASADFSLKPCPVVPPAKVTPAALPSTGAGPAEGLLLGAGLLLGFGAAVTAFSRRRLAERG